VTLAYIAFLIFTCIFIFIYTYNKTHRLKTAVIAMLIVVKFITLLCWALGFDRVLFTISIVHRRTGIEVLHFDVTANFIAWLSSLGFMLFCLVGPKLKPLLPSWLKWIIPKWLSE